MALDADALVTPPTIAQKATIANQGGSWGDMGAEGQLSYSLPIPVVKARDLNPDLQLSYNSGTGNGICGVGWDLPVPAIMRKTSKGAPLFLPTDTMQIGNLDLHPQQTTRGRIKAKKRMRGKGRHARSYSVVPYIPRVETTFTRYELWTPTDGGHPFWRVFDPDGTEYCYGITLDSCIHAPENTAHIAVWLLVEIRSPVGENIVYAYKRDNTAPDPRFDYRAQRYLYQVCYGNKTPSTSLLCLTHPEPKDLDWLFRVIIDYGERSIRLEDRPPFKAPDDNVLLPRSDPFRMHRFGFELGTQFLCRQVLLYNCMGSAPALVNRLLLEYSETELKYNQLTAANYISYDASGGVKHSPPIELSYSWLELDHTPKPFLHFDHMPGANDGQLYHCADLCGEGLPGFLCQYDNAWYYREPLRGEPGTDEIVYGHWTLLPLIPNADSSKPVVVILIDLTGDGCLDWVVAQPGGSGYYTLNPDKTWSLFKSFDQFPLEFFNRSIQLGDFSGDGLPSAALIGPNCVRVYANLREKGFAPGKDVPHIPNPSDPEDRSDRLPQFIDFRTEIVMFANLHASDRSGLCRVRHDGIETWANLGHGKFGKGVKISALPFKYQDFNAEQIRFADLDGSGAPALIHLCSDHFEIYWNYGGNAFEQVPVIGEWPEGVRYDNHCQVTFADLRGIGCASMLLTVPHMKPQHWVYHFVRERPYLLNYCNNNMGYSSTLKYRSSAQFWLDEKRQLLIARERPVSRLPFSQMVLHWLRQDDEITGNYMMQSYDYFEAYYDGKERESRGFGRVCQIDSELEPGKAESGHTAPMRMTKWFHTGRSIDPVLNATNKLDGDIEKLGPVVITEFDAKRRKERIRMRRNANDDEIAYALAGRLLCTEVCQADDPAPARLFSKSESRYMVRMVNKNPSSLLVLELETRSHQYERHMNDPQCQHTVNLAWDKYGCLIHSFTTACARRLTADDEPPYDRDDQVRAWKDSHDEPQQYFYLTESRAEFIHLTDDDHWLLGLPRRQRSNALKLPKGVLPGGLRPGDIRFEIFDRYKDSPEWTSARELTSLSQQTYLEVAGKIHYPPLAGPAEQAVFDKKALAAYDKVPPPFVIRDELVKIGYMPMKLFFPEDPAQDLLKNLWSAQSGFFTYTDANGFYHVTDVQRTASHGVTHITWDANHLLVIAITLPDGCTTTVTYDLHTLQPRSTTDANNNIREVIYEPGGQPSALSSHGTENGQQAGFKPLSEYPEQRDLSVKFALDHSEEVLAGAASVVRTELRSWMPSLPPKTLPRKRKEWIAKGLILPDGRIRASALRWLNQRKKRTASEQTLLKIIRTAKRQPVHSAILAADCYPDDPQRQIQINIAYVDGFARPLQNKQLVPPGDALKSTDDGDLVIGADGNPIEEAADPRWRVQARVEYNHKDEPIRVYRSYYLDTHLYINDSAMREHGYHDRMFYDALGRPIQTINALGHLAYDIRHAWFTLRYDCNDTDDTPATRPAKPARQTAKPAKKVKS